MTIETILPSILTECGIDVVSPQINASDYQMRQILEVMNAAGRDIASRTEWAKMSKTLTVAASVSEVAVPADFQEMAEGGAVVTGGSTFSPIRPVISPSMWQMLSKTASSQPYYHLDGGNIKFSPATPTDGASVRYVSKNWLSGDKSAVTANTDVTLFPENLLARGTIYRWKRQKGLPFDDLMAEFEADLETAIKADRGVL